MVEGPHASPPPITDSSKKPSSNRVEEKVGLSAGVYTQGGGLIGREIRYLNRMLTSDKFPFQRCI